MPRVSMSKDQKKKKDRTDNIKGLIADGMARYGYTNESLANKILMSVGTFRNKKGNPGTFTLDEWYRLGDALHWKMPIIREVGPDEA